MRHKVRKGHLNRFTSWRRATVNSTIRNLITYGRITTTKTKAVVVKPLAEKIITLAKENTLAAKRRAYSVLCSHQMVSRLFTEIGPLFKDVPGGYCRIMNLGNRRGDNAEVVILEFTRLPKTKEKPVVKHSAKKDVIETSAHQQEPEKETGHAEPTHNQDKKHHTDHQKSGKKFLGNIKGIFNKKTP